MSFEFEEGQTTNYVTKRAPKGIVGFLIKNKIAKDTSQANIIMLGTFGVCIIIILVVILSNTSSNIPGPEQLVDPTTINQQQLDLAP